MKQVYKITDKRLVTDLMQKAEYGVLALSCNDKPYAAPVNFIYFNGNVYFHGSPKGKKMRILSENNKVSFNVVSQPVIIPSYFSSADNLACPATSFFKSVIIEGKVKVVKKTDEKLKAFTALMQKLQPEGNYAEFKGDVYAKKLKGVALMKIKIKNLSAKFKFGQNLNKQRFDRVIRHLKQRATDEDLLTIKQMQKFYVI